MTPEEQKTIDRLVSAINTAYGSFWRLFFRGIVSGIAQGLGATIGLAIVVAVGIYLFKLSGLDQTFKDIFHSLYQLSESLNAAKK